MAQSEIKEAVQTADGKILYEPYYSIVQKVHEENCKFYGWKFTPLKPGAYGYDNLVYTIHDSIKFLETGSFSAEEKGDETKRDDTLNKLASVIHGAWTKNYIFWRDNKPYEKESEKYRKPFKPIDDERRNRCANALFEELDEEEKTKDIVLAKIIYGLHQAVTNTPS